MPHDTREAAGFVTLWITVFVSMMGFGITIVPFPIVAEQFGASPFWVTWGGTGSFALTQLISTALLGRLSDRVGRKPVLLLGLVGATVGYLWTATADNLPSLLAARAVTGLAAGYLAAAFAYVSDVSRPAMLARRMGLLGAAFGLGFTAGPFLGGLLGRAPDGTATLHAPCLFAAGLSALGLLGTLFALRESHVPQARTRRTRSPAATMADHPGARAALLGIGSAMLAITTGMAALQSIYPIWGRDTYDLPLEQIGWHFGVLSACTALSQVVLIGPLVRRFGDHRVMNMALFGSAAGLALYAVAPRIEAVWAADILCGTSLGLFSSAATAAVATLAPPALRGAILGLVTSSSAAGRVLGPAYAGAAYAIARPSPFIVGAVLIVASGLAVIAARRKTRSAR
jgi:MFS family permease